MSLALDVPAVGLTVEIVSLVMLPPLEVVSLSAATACLVLGFHFLSDAMTCLFQELVYPFLAAAVSAGELDRYSIEFHCVFDVCFLCTPWTP